MEATMIVCNKFALAATNNIISDGGDHGITTGGITLDTANMVIANNHITGSINFANAIALAHQGANLNFVVTGNNMSNNATSGIILFPSTTIENVAVKIENNTINNNLNAGFNASGGIDLEEYINLSGTITNNTLLNNSGPGVYINSTQPSSAVCVGMVGNNSNTGYTLSNGSGTFNVTPCNVDTVNTGVITTIGTVNTVQSCPSGVPCPP
jgi:hypothetical protein